MCALSAGASEAPIPLCRRSTDRRGLVISDNLNCVSDMVCAEVCSECGVHVCMDM